jgi:hypothetical protein
MSNNVEIELEYGYLLFEIQPKEITDPQAIKEELIHILNIIINKHKPISIKIKPLNLIYPTNDQKCYFCSTKSQCDLIKDVFIKNENKLNFKQFHLSLKEVEFDEQLFVSHNILI